MKWMIASDIHGSAYYCRKLLEAYTEEGADRLLLLGDILYHGPRNDLPRDYAPKEVIALLNERKNDIYCVRGNCDTEVGQMVLEFPGLGGYCHYGVPVFLFLSAYGLMPPMDISIMSRNCRHCIPEIFYCTVILMCRNALFMRQSSISA